MKKLITGFLILTVLITTLVGCGKGSTSNSSDEKVTLKLWLPPFGTQDVLDDEMWEPVLSKFEEENNVEIELTIVGWDTYEEKYTTGITGNAGPDIGYMYAEMLPEYIEMGALSPLGEYVSEEQKENYIYYDKGNMYGEQYGLPIVVGAPRVLFYNKAILEELGEEAPVTWEDFERISNAATKDTDGDGKTDQWGYAAGWGGKAYGDLNENFYPFLWQAGGSLYADDNESVAFNSEAGQKALEFLYKLRFEDKVIPDTSSVQSEGEMLGNYFGPGKAAFYIGSTNTVTKQLEEFPDLEWGYVTSLTDKQQGTMIAVDQLVLMSATEYPELSAKLINYLLSKESMERFHEFNKFPPVTKDEDYNGDPMFEDIFTNDVDALVPLKPAPKAFTVYDFLFKQLQQVMSGDKEPAEALEEAENYANDILSQQ
jgi:ABC-type glycerol-3-phosphate transport system substrate-binding protein